MSAIVDSAAAPRIDATDVTVRFGGLVAVDKVSISVQPAQIVGLVGPNGAGKSTLFSVLSGLRAPNEGSVRIDGEDVTDASPQLRAERGLARTFQHPELFQGLTIREHLILAYRMRNSPRRVWMDLITAGGFRRTPKEEKERIGELLDLLHLTKIQYRPVIGLPLGLARLVEIGRALARDPSVILLDEASSGLDAQETDELTEALLKVVHERAVSLLLVEHDVDLVLGMSNRVCVLDFGRRIAEGTPDEIRRDPAVRAAYLGEETDAPTTPGVPA
jgi:branched-chain amino acid transport system ATP-binding protein